jgi:hypothetical protein
MKAFLMVMLLAFGAATMASAWSPAYAATIRIDPNGAP